MIVPVPTRDSVNLLATYPPMTMDSQSGLYSKEPLRESSLQRAILKQR